MDSQSPELSLMRYRMKKYRVLLFGLLFFPLFGVVMVSHRKTNDYADANTLAIISGPVEAQFEFNEDGVRQKRPDHGFLATLRAAGINSACQDLGIDFNAVFGPLAAEVAHPYRQYRWSVSRDEHGNSLIHALPPEEEMGWTPWERWSLHKNTPIRTAWVLYPVKESIKKGIVRWYTLEESEDLTPRFLHKAEDLDTMLRLARIDAVADWLGMDFEAVFIDPLMPSARQIYAQYRWVVIPHTLANDGPVIYAFPPMDRSDDWPWESWYTDGTVPVIHHVHYTREKSNTTGSWSEGAGAPQRPPEIFGPVWYWYDDPAMIPALSQQD
jgi:hypothetical protein